MEIKLEGLGLVVKGHCLLSELTSPYKSLNEMLNSDRNSIILDLSKVETIDTAGLQLLLACRKSALENGKTFQLNPNVTLNLPGFSVVFRKLLLRGYSLSFD